MPARKPLAPVIPVPTRVNLLAPTGPARIDNARHLPIDQVDPNPNQARQAFDAAALAELTESVRQHGVLQPILVRPVGERFEIVAGERRYRAARGAGLPTIPALLRDDVGDHEAAILTALENLQREDLDLEDEARQFAHLLALTGLSQRALADKLGIGYNYLSRRVRLLSRPELLAAVRAGTLPLNTALAQLGDERPASAAVSPGHTPAPGVVERPDLDAAVSPGHTAVPGPAPRWRYVEAAYRPLKRIVPGTVPVAERGEWVRQLRALAEYAHQLAQAIEAES